MANVYRQKPNTAGRVINGMAFVVTPDSNKMHTLNRTAAAVWKLAEQGCTVDEAADLLHRQFAVDRSAAARDVNSCCDDLVRRGILVCQ